jgi:hypothetical protein
MLVGMPVMSLDGVCSISSNRGVTGENREYNLRGFERHDVGIEAILTSE